MYKIILFIVKYKGNIIQVDGIYDKYTEIQIYSINQSIKDINGMKYSSGEAKDIVGEYGDIEVLIQEKEITL